MSQSSIKKSRNDIKESILEEASRETKVEAAALVSKAECVRVREFSYWCDAREQHDYSLQPSFEQNFLAL